jgi:hypothetical protein
MSGQEGKKYRGGADPADGRLLPMSVASPTEGEVARAQI